MSIQERREEAGRLRASADTRERVAKLQQRWAKEDRAEAALHDTIANEQEKAAKSLKVP